MKVFVSGVAGFLGSYIADAMIALGHEVIGNDNLVGGDIDNVPAGVRFYPDDCRDRSQVANHMRGVDLVYHCAALAYEGLSVFSPYTVVSSIVDASTSMFSAAIENKVNRIVFCSSMARYGKGQPPFYESDSPRPQDPYGIAKVAAEDILRNLCEVHQIEYLVAVPHNIIGPRQRYIDPFRNVASIMLNRMMQGKQPIIYGDGTQQRCFSFIDDCLSCLVKMGTQDGLSGQTINIGPDEEPVTINELAQTIADIIDFQTLDPIYMPGRPQEVKIALCSSVKAREILGYETTTSLRSGLRKMADYIQTRGTRPFSYHLPVEFVTEKTPRTWTDRLF